MFGKVIEARWIAKSWGTTTILRDVSLDVAAGELVSIMGPSGSGKSTLLSILGGLDRPTHGRVRFEGADVASLSDAAGAAFRRRRIGFVFQAFHLLPALGVVDNVVLPLALDGRGGRAAREKAEALLVSLGLGGRMKHEVHRLSGGEMQRVAIARALVTDPAAILADEPTGNLDAHTGEGVLRILRDAVAERGIACVMVTHDPRAAMYGTRLVTLRDGRVAGDDPIDPRKVLRAVA